MAKYVGASFCGLVVGCLCFILFFIIAGYFTIKYESEKADTLDISGYCKVYEITTSRTNLCDCGRFCGSDSCYYGVWHIYLITQEQFGNDNPEEVGWKTAISAISREESKEAKVEKMSEKHPINSVSMCWYNPADKHDVRWDQPDTSKLYPGAVLLWMICGMFAVVVLISACYILGLLLTRR